MNIKTTHYLELEKEWPQSGQHILAYQTEDCLVVYQAYNNAIADFAIKNQFLGGSSFSYSRMSWIKPNFLWMMYRCGWASKENQERVIALWIKKSDFEVILSQAVFSSFNGSKYDTHAIWKQQLESKDVRLQWDPDHDPYGNKLARRAIQLGLRGKALEEFGKNGIIKIEDMTEFVLQQKKAVNPATISELQIPQESIFVPTDFSLISKIDITT